MEHSNPNHKSAADIQSAVIRFAGDSGDGMQLSGSQFTLATALNMQELTTFPDFPAEIRAPQGTTYGVSAFQIHFGAGGVHTVGDKLDALVAMNPAALKVHLEDLKPYGLVIADSGAFDKRSLEKAGYDSNPLEDDSLSAYRVLALDIGALAQLTAEEEGLDKSLGYRARNVWTLGLLYWLFNRDSKPTLDWLESKFAKKNPDAYKVNRAALKAGNIYAETAGLSPEFQPIETPKAQMQAGKYRNATGYETLTWGLIAGTKLANLSMTLCSYPITPATTMLHTASKLPQFGVKSYQAEDEIAAIGAAIGASWAGSLGVTTSSGPGIALKTEALGLAIATELPLIVVNVQRGGPSTGLPTKTEQSDVLQAIWGRNGDAPMVVLAVKSPADAFDVGVQAVCYATKYMTPVMILSDGFIAGASGAFKLPKLEDYTPFPVSFRQEVENFMPYARNAETLARDWAIPGTKGLEHRIGGLERHAQTGMVSTDAENHQLMSNLRKQKIDNVARDYAPLTMEIGEDSGDLLVLGWGSTWGSIYKAVENAVAEGKKVSHVHLRNIFPLPKDLGTVLGRFKHVIMPEMNMGQLVHYVRSETLVDVQSITKVNGKPFLISEIQDAINAHMKG